MKRLIVLLVAVGMGILIGCTQKIPLPDVEIDQLDLLEAHINKAGQDPVTYLVNSFDDKDIVFLGEYHRIKHDLDLVARTIPALHEAGINVLGIEFARAEDQDLIDALINGDKYDQKQANEIIFNWSTSWGYQEYTYLFKVAWEINQTLEPGEEAFRIVGLDAIEDYSHIQSEEDWAKENIMELIYPQGDRDLVMGQTVLNEIVAKGQKALIYSGINHAFTKFQQPIYDGRTQELYGYSNERMGNIVYEEIGDRAMTVFLHGPWTGMNEPNIYPVDGVVDVLLKEREIEPVGFDVAGSPFAALKGETSGWIVGYPDFNFGMYCDGYILHKPLSEYEGVSYSEGFITEENLKLAVDGMSNLDIKNRRQTVKSFENIIRKDANMKKRFKIFE